MPELTLHDRTDDNCDSMCAIVNEQKDRISFRFQAHNSQNIVRLKKEELIELRGFINDFLDQDEVVEEPSNGIKMGELKLVDRYGDGLLIVPSDNTDQLFLDLFDSDGDESNMGVEINKERAEKLINYLRKFLDSLSKVELVDAEFPEVGEEIQEPTWPKLSKEDEHILRTHVFRELFERKRGEELKTGRQIVEEANIQRDIEQAKLRLITQSVIQHFAPEIAGFQKQLNELKKNKEYVPDLMSKFAEDRIEQLAHREDHKAIARRFINIDNTLNEIKKELLRTKDALHEAQHSGARDVEKIHSRLQRLESATLMLVKTD